MGKGLQSTAFSPCRDPCILSHNKKITKFKHPSLEFETETTGPAVHGLIDRPLPQGTSYGGELPNLLLLCMQHKAQCKHPKAWESSFYFVNS